MYGSDSPDKIMTVLYEFVWRLVRALICMAIQNVSFKPKLANDAEKTSFAWRSNTHVPFAIPKGRQKVYETPLSTSYLTELIKPKYVHRR